MITKVKRRAHARIRATAFLNRLVITENKYCGYTAMVLSRGRNIGCTCANAIPAKVRMSEKASTAVIPLGHIFQSFTAVLIKLSIIYYLLFVLNSLAP